MNNQNVRICLIVGLVTFLLFIGSIFTLKTISSFNSGILEENYNDSGKNIPSETFENVYIINDECCGHSDVTPPLVIVWSPGNGSVVLGGTTLYFNITDDNPFADLKPSEVYYRWDTDETNTTFIEPYTLTIPEDNRTYTLYIYAVDDSNNWATAIFVFTVTTDPESVSEAPPPTDLPTKSSTTNYNGLVELIAVLSLLGVKRLFFKK